MVVTTKDSVFSKSITEMNGQQTMFGYDNLEFKTINQFHCSSLCRFASRVQTKEVS